jgi:pimeloyl-ACP methyl ester carboxylesterase
VIDTNEELSAFEPVLLEHQTRFALACLRHLAAAYSLAPPNGTAAAHKSGSDAGGNRRGGNAQLPAVAGMEEGGDAMAAAAHGGMFLVGHSMGGVVARMALSRAAADPFLGPKAVALLITMASPQAAPPALLAPAVARLQRRLWRSALPEGVPVVSINGGARDLQVRGGRGPEI